MDELTFKAALILLGFDLTKNTNNKHLSKIVTKSITQFMVHNRVHVEIYSTNDKLLDLNPLILISGSIFNGETKSFIDFENAYMFINEENI